MPPANEYSANTKVTVVIPDEQETNDDLSARCMAMSEESFRAIWDNPLDADYDPN